MRKEEKDERAAILCFLALTVVFVGVCLGIIYFFKNYG